VREKNKKVIDRYNNPAEMEEAALIVFENYNLSVWPIFIRDRRNA
jgi:hypothetical protein